MNIQVAFVRESYNMTLTISYHMVHEISLVITYKGEFLLTIVGITSIIDLQHFFK